MNIVDLSSKDIASSLPLLRTAGRSRDFVLRRQKVQKRLTFDLMSSDIAIMKRRLLSLIIFFKLLRNRLNLDQKYVLLLFLAAAQAVILQL